MSPANKPLDLRYATLYPEGIHDGEKQDTGPRPQRYYFNKPRFLHLPLHRKMLNLLI